MSGNKLVLLLDIDGVLLEAHGYRLACIDTINHLIAQMGQPELYIDRGITDAFETAGIRAEWDMVPLTIAAFTNWYIEQSGQVPSAETFPPRCDAVRLDDRDAFLEMLRGMVDEFGRCMNPAVLGIEGIYAAYRSGKGKGLEKLQETPYFERFFVDTLDPWKSPFLAELENRLLGRDVYEEFYGMAAPVDCGSYLAEKDIPLISDHYRQLLPEISKQAAVYPVVMTYRPTRMPAFAGEKGSAYFVNTPEGECALKLFGWDDGKMKIIGLGSLCYEEEKLGLRREFYSKPHPFHAIASILYALSGNEEEALDMAALLCAEEPSPQNNPAQKNLNADETLTAAVFEDSDLGIQSVENAVELLRKWGMSVEPVLCGIRTIPEKDALLEKTGAKLYANVNDAFDDVLKTYLDL